MSLGSERIKLKDGCCPNPLVHRGTRWEAGPAARGLESLSQSERDEASCDCHRDIAPARKQLVFRNRLRPVLQ